MLAVRDHRQPGRAPRRSLRSGPPTPARAPRLRRRAARARRKAPRRSPSGIRARSGTAASAGAPSRASRESHSPAERGRRAAGSAPRRASRTPQLRSMRTRERSGPVSRTTMRSRAMAAPGHAYDTTRWPHVSVGSSQIWVCGSPAGARDHVDAGRLVEQRGDPARLRIDLDPQVLVLEKRLGHRQRSRGRARPAPGPDRRRYRR